MHDNDIPSLALKWHREQGAVIATVVNTWGSAPRQAGSQLAISANGQMEGSVSGGCVEGAVVAEAIDVLKSGYPKMLEFGVSDDQAFSVGLACGGKISILLEPIDSEFGITEELLVQLVECHSQNKAVAYCVNIRTWERIVVSDHSSPIGSAVTDRLYSDRSGMEGDWFVSVHNPPLRMIVVGGVHIAQPLLKMAQLAGFNTVLVDPRSAFANDKRFPQETIISDWPDEVIPELNPDARTAIVTLTHDPKIDDAAIKAALLTSTFYIGCLGSKRTHTGRCQRLKLEGVSNQDIARLHGPVGLDIGARTPSEIAVAIMAEVICSLRVGAKLGNGKESLMMEWTSWCSFPDPKLGGYLSAPFGPGVYELRDQKSDKLLYCGEGNNLAKRMTSLLPSDKGGSGTRKNACLRKYLHDNLANIEYRTRACASKSKAEEEERIQLSNNNYRFNKKNNDS